MLDDTTVPHPDTASDGAVNKQNKNSSSAYRDGSLPNTLSSQCHRLSMYSLKHLYQIIHTRQHR